MPGYGFTGHIGFARETTWGTPVAVASGDYIEALSESLTLDIERFDTDNIVARYSEPDDHAGLRRLAGELVFAARPLHLGHFFKNALGRVVSRTVVLSGFLWETAYEPNIAEDGANNPLPSTTLEIFRDVTSAHRYAGVQFTKFGLAIEPNQDLRVTAELIAKTTSVIAKTTPTYPSTATSPFTFDTTSVQLAGAAVDVVEALAIDFDSQLEGIPALNNTAEVARVRRRGPQLVRVSGTFGFENLTDYERFVQQSEAALTVSWTKANSFRLIASIPRLVYTAFPLGMSGRERLTVGFEGMGRYHAGSGSAIQFRLTSVKSDY